MSSLGNWDIIGTSGVVCIHTALLPSSRLLCIERPHENPYPFNANTNGRTATEVKLLNDDGEWAPSWTVKPLRTNAFCAGHVQLGDGSILVAGGDMREVPDEVGVLKYLTDGRRGVRKYVPCTTSDCDTGEWTDFPDMLVERWYPTAATLADGSAIIISGTKDSLTLDGTSTDAIKNPTYEYFPPKEGEWPRNLEILNWAHPFVLYPQVFQLPSGGVFLFVSNKSVIIDPETDIVTDDFRDLTSPTHLPWIYPWSPNMVMLPMLAKNKYRCELLMCGGSYSGPAGETLSSNECFRLNTTAKGSGWVKETQGMPYGQVMLDSAILPDGKILFVNGAGWGVGGGDGGNTQNAGHPMMKTSLFDPEAPEGKRWRELAEFQVPRLYHSGVILVEAGHVVTMGSEMQNFDDKDPSCFPRGPRVCTDPYEYRLERFTPPYLLTGKQRPALSSSPETLTYKSVFFVNLKTGIRITRVSFIRYSTTTHNTNSDQRMIELPILSQTRSSSGESSLYLKAPPNGEMAPPGNWMLFVLADGVPSIAKTIRLEHGDPTSVEVPPDSFTSGEVAGNPFKAIFIGSLVSAVVIFLVGVWI